MRSSPVDSTFHSYPNVRIMRDWSSQRKDNAKKGGVIGWKSLAVRERCYHYFHQLVSLPVPHSFINGGDIGSFFFFWRANVLPSRGQSALAMRIEVHRVDRGIVIVPGNEQRGGLHRSGLVTATRGPTKKSRKFPCCQERGRASVDWRRSFRVRLLCQLIGLSKASSWAA